MHPAERQLDLLATFHYVLGGLLVILSFIPLLYLSFIWHILRNPEITHSPNPPPEFLGPLFLIAGIVFVIMGWAYAAVILLAARFLQQRKNRIYCLVVAALACMFQPFGTI